MCYYALFRNYAIQGEDMPTRVFRGYMLLAFIVGVCKVAVWSENTKEIPANTFFVFTGVLLLVGLYTHIKLVMDDATNTLHRLLSAIMVLGYVIGVGLVVFIATHPELIPPTSVYAIICLLMNGGAVTYIVLINRAMDQEMAEEEKADNNPSPHRNGL